MITLETLDIEETLRQFHDNGYRLELTPIVDRDQWAAEVWIPVGDDGVGSRCAVATKGTLRECLLECRDAAVTAPVEGQTIWGHRSAGGKDVSSRVAEPMETATLRADEPASRSPTPPTDEQIAYRLMHRASLGQDVIRHNKVRVAAVQFSRLLRDNTPASPEQQRALDAVDDAMRLASAAIVRGPMEKRPS